MTSPLLALFTRSLREDTRAKSTYWARAGLATFMLFVMWTAASARASGGAPGLVFLQSSAWLQAMFLTISGLGFFASAITEEKEEETLGLLRMTNLSPLSILLGKSTSRLGSALLLLLAQVPFTLMAVTLGGVSPGQVLAAYATLGAYTFLLCNLALLASVIMQRTVSAVALTGGVLLGVFWAGAEADARVAAASPFRRLAAIFQTGFDGRILGFQVAVNLAAGAVCFLLAWLLFRWLCESSAEAASASFCARRWLRRGRFAPGRPCAGPSALRWRDYHFFHGGSAVACAKWVVCGALMLGAGVVIFANIGEQSGGESGEAVATLFSIGLFGVVAELGFIASRLCSTEVRGQTLSSLALLPQSLAVTFGAKASGCWRVLAPWGALFGCAMVLALVSGLVSNRSENLTVLFVGGIFCGYIFSMAFFGAHLTAYLSLRMKRGALPLAIIICLVSGVFSIIPLIGWYGVPVLAIVFGFQLRKKIIAHLEDLAAES